MMTHQINSLNNYHIQIFLCALQTFIYHVSTALVHCLIFRSAVRLLQKSNIFCEAGILKAMELPTFQRRSCWQLSAPSKRFHSSECTVWINGENTANRVLKTYILFKTILLLYFFCYANAIGHRRTALGAQ